MEDGVPAGVAELLPKLPGKWAYPLLFLNADWYRRPFGVYPVGPASKLFDKSLPLSCAATLYLCENNSAALCGFVLPEKTPRLSVVLYCRKNSAALCGFVLSEKLRGSLWFCIVEKTPRLSVVLYCRKKPALCGLYLKLIHYFIFW